jgi:hypothetical protein
MTDEHLASRGELAMRFYGQGVELGVAAGAFSREILRNTSVSRLFSIDRWADHHDAREYKSAVESLVAYGQGRGMPLRMTFNEALLLFEDGSLDFIYVDGYAHTGQEGGKTLSDWWSKLKVGGIFAGHDYDPAKWPKTVAAVDRFAYEHDLIIRLTGGADQYPSWWGIKPGEPPPPSFILREDSPVNEGQSVILVGNAPSAVMRGDRGNFIDAHDCVVRFNWFAIRGFERQVGTKTDLWSTFGRGSLPRDEDQRPERAVFIHGDKPKSFAYQVKEAWGISREFFTAVNDLVRQESERGEDLSRKLLPSSGLVVALWLLDLHKVEKLTVLGFDHFSKAESKGHHYWKRKPNGQMLPFKKPPEHDGEAEARILAPYIEMGRITQV